MIAWDLTQVAPSTPCIMGWHGGSQMYACMPGRAAPSCTGPACCSLRTWPSGCCARLARRASVHITAGRCMRWRAVSQHACVPAVCAPRWRCGAGCCDGVPPPTPARPGLGTLGWAHCGDASCVAAGPGCGPWRCGGFYAHDFDAKCMSVHVCLCGRQVPLWLPSFSTVSPFAAFHFMPVCLAPPCLPLFPAPPFLVAQCGCAPCSAPLPQRVRQRCSGYVTL